MGELNEEWGEIFVRPCWPALWAQMQMAAASQPGVPQRLALAAGARGTGRRAMMFYVLWRLSLEPGVPAVVVQTAQHECLAFTRGQRVYKGDDIASFANLLELPGTWLLTHEKFDPEISQGASASLLLITSRHFGTGQVHLRLISAWPALHIATLLHVAPGITLRIICPFWEGTNYASFRSHSMSFTTSIFRFAGTARRRLESVLSSALGPA